MKMRTSNHDTYNTGSHVMEYGDKSVKSDMLSLYQGFEPAIANVTENALRLRMPMGVINQRDADLLFMWKMVSNNNFFFFFIEFYLLVCLPWRSKSRAPQLVIVLLVFG